MPKIRITEFGGSPYEMGYQHGQRFARQIREIAQERIHLSSDSAWTGRSIHREDVLRLGEACLTEHYHYAPDLMQELEGMAAATGLTMTELMIANGFTDFVDVLYNAMPEAEPVPALMGNECTAFMVNRRQTRSGYAFLGQTWDMHATATPYVVLMRGRPAYAPSFVVFTITGCVGMIGMNSAGIAVGINNLMAADGQPGVTWPFVVRKILQQTNLDAALDCLLDAPLAGAHNYLLMDANGQGYNVEAGTTAHHVEALTREALVHTNACLYEDTLATERPLTDDLVQDSRIRQQRAEEIILQRPVTPQRLMKLTRDRSDGSFSICAMSEPPFYSETCGAVIMRPATREMWAVWGLPRYNKYQRFRVA